MIKNLLFALLITCTTTIALADDGMFRGFTKSEIKFIKNIEVVQQENITSISRQGDTHIMVVFPTAKYLLNLSTGFVANVWILGDDDITWEEMGPEY
jgi:hypothetical protein